MAERNFDMDGMLESVNTQEAAEPVGTSVETNVDAVETTVEEGANEQVTAEPVAQTKEENAQFAAARRASEERVRMMDSEVKRLFGNQINPLTQRPIETFDDYVKAVEYSRQKAQEQELISKGINPALIADMVNNAPAVREAQQYLQQSRREQASKNLDADFKEITKMDPNIKTMDDLQKHPSFGAVLGYVRDNGLKIHEAFRLANYTQLSNASADAARQAAINQAKGKNHLETTTESVSHNDGLMDIPAKDLAKWKAFYPNATNKELKEKYNRVHRQ